MSESLQADRIDMANVVVLIQSFLFEMDVNKITGRSSQFTELLNFNIVSGVVKLSTGAGDNISVYTTVEIDDDYVHDTNLYDYVFDTNLFSKHHRKRSRPESVLKLT